mmetsp:Transcript_36585/g.66335  ORF Transcript_36585/g.66335 Transcript_36585/m.66335 type:complete len:180 (+) Transcript_36585:54-593(+)
MTRLALAIFLAAATKTWACNSTETCVWANASRTIKNKAVGILQQEGGSAEEFLHLNPQTPTDMLQLQALVQGALDAMGPEHEDSAMTFLKTVRAAMDVVKTQINAPGLKVAGRSQYGEPCPDESCRPGMCNRAILACGAVCGIGCALGVCPLCLTCLATYVGCCECASIDFGFACNACL